MKILVPTEGVLLIDREYPKSRESLLAEKRGIFTVDNLCWLEHKDERSAVGLVLRLAGKFSLWTFTVGRN